MHLTPPPRGPSILSSIGSARVRLPAAVCRIALATVLIALIVLGNGAASANPISDFGLNYTSVGNASLTLAKDGGVEVSNIGSSGQDGVSVDLTNVPNSGTSTPSFAIDTSANPGAIPTGGFFEVTNYGPVASGTAPIVSTMTETQNSTETFYTTDFSNSSNGPVTTNYYSAGKLIYSEQNTLNFALAVRKAGVSDPTYYTDYTWNENGPYVSSGQDLSNAFSVDVLTSNGTVLPAADDIDLIDSFAPANFPPSYSSISYTASGISSFEIAGEALLVPEPTTGALLIFTLTCSVMRRRRISL